MKGPYETTIIVVSLVLAAWGFIQVVRNRPLELPLLVGAAVLELFLLGLLVVGVVAMVGTDHHFARVEFVGYLLGCLAIPPIAALWGLGERNRSGTAVLAIAFLIMPVMVVRVQQVWAGPRG